MSNGKGVIGSEVGLAEGIIGKDIHYYKPKNNHTFTIIDEVKSMLGCLLDNIKYEYKKKR